MKLITVSVPVVTDAIIKVNLQLTDKQVLIIYAVPWHKTCLMHQFCPSAKGILISMSFCSFKYRINLANLT
jgi:hypothetical protein